MKRIAGILLGIALTLSVVGISTKAQAPQPVGFRYESSLLFAQQGDGIGGLLVNLDSVSHTYRVVISQFLGNPTPTIVVDTGVQPISSGARASGGFLVPSGVVDNFEVTITTDSDSVVPNVVIQAPCVAIPCPPPRFWLYGGQLVKFKVF